jgi:hypothetical protein
VSSLRKCVRLGTASSSRRFGSGEASSPHSDDCGVLENESEECVELRDEERGSVEATSV